MHTSQLWGGLHAHFITKFSFRLFPVPVSNKEHVLLFFLLGTVEYPRTKTAQLPSPGCCRTIDGGAPRQLAVPGCSACLLLSEGIGSTACSRNSSGKLDSPTVPTLITPLFLTAVASLMPQETLKMWFKSCKLFRA